MNVEHFAGYGVDPAIEATLARKNQGVDAFVVDDGELYILFERSFDGQSPHHRTLPSVRQPTIHRVDRIRGCYSGRPITQPACFGNPGPSAEIDPTNFRHR